MFTVAPRPAAVPVDERRGYAMRDANEENFRYLNHFFDNNLAKSVRAYDAIQRRYQGIPWVNSIAADSKGEAYYSMDGAIPNVPNDQAPELRRRAEQRHVHSARAADARRLALGVRLGDRSRRGRAGHLRAVERSRGCSATTTRTTATTPTG